MPMRRMRSSAWPAAGLLLGVGQRGNPGFVGGRPAFGYYYGIYPDAVFKQLYRPLAGKGVAPAVGRRVGRGVALAG
nr:hypothetical protein [Tanacetum cinerariifolium]